MAQIATMNQAQLQILDMLSFIKTPEALRDLNKVISDYFVLIPYRKVWNAFLRGDSQRSSLYFCFN